MEKCYLNKNYNKICKKINKTSKLCLQSIYLMCNQKKITAMAHFNKMIKYNTIQFKENYQ